MSESRPQTFWGRQCLAAVSIPAQTLVLKAHASMGFAVSQLLLRHLHILMMTLEPAGRIVLPQRSCCWDSPFSLAAHRGSAGVVAALRMVYRAVFCWLCFGGLFDGCDDASTCIFVQR